MSRIGRLPVPVPSGVTVTIEPELVAVKGSLGELSEKIALDIGVEQQGDELVITRPTDRGEHRALHGLTRSLIANMVTGVTSGFQKVLELQGVGYRANMQGKDLVLALGFSHEVRFPVPAGITLTVDKQTKITITGIDKSLVGLTAAKIKGFKPPEPYKGKGIRYEGQFVLRKEGKKK